MTALRRPELIAQHVANYAALIKADMTAVGTRLAIRAASAAVALVALLLGLGLTGVAIMLGYVHGKFHWVLVAVPSVAWLLAVAGGFVAMELSVTQQFADVRDEVEADLNALRLIKEIEDDR